MNKDKENREKGNRTINDIRSTFPEEKRIFERNNLFGHFVFRRISYYLTWLFIRFGISANEVTGISILIGWIGCILLAFSSYSYSGVIVGALILNVWALLEFVDGNVARATNSSSNYGAFIDDLNVSIMSVFLFTCAGIGAFNYSEQWLNSVVHILDVNIGKSVFLFLGCWASLCYIVPRFIGYEFQKVFSQKQIGRDDVIGSPSSFLNIISSNFYNLTGLVMPILLFAVIFKFLGIFVLLFALINTAAFVVLIYKLLRRAKSIEGLQSG